jgi:hypothetical protein
MGLFSSKNNTISDKKMADLKRRGQKASAEPMFSKRAADRRKASGKQQKKAGWN